MPDIKTTLDACELVWRQQSLPSRSITDMRAELESHLSDAAKAGKTTESVVGPDLNVFARNWASVDTNRQAPATTERSETLAAAARQASKRLTIALGLIALVAIIGLIVGPRGDSPDLETWQWIFVVGAFGLLVGELLTGGFFVLPFALGAAISALLSFTNVEPPTLVVVFVLSSVLGLWGLHEWASKDDDTVVPVGANRYVGQVAVVTEPISGLGTVGRVKVETESWMAVTDHNEHIAAGAVVNISEVRGARLVVRTS